MVDEPKASETARVIRDLAQVVPIYQDAVQPAAKEIGQALETVAKTVHIALAPIAAFVWGYEQIRDFVSTRVAEKLRTVPAERVVTPSPMVAGPALEALRYAGHNDTLRELYANLLATSMDSATARSAHPAFVEILRAMSPDEARIMRLFLARSSYPAVDLRGRSKDGTGHAEIMRNYSHLGREAGCENPDLTPAYLDNLNRLGLVELRREYYLTAPGTYEPLENDELMESLKLALGERFPDRELEFSRFMVILTAFGKEFRDACIREKEPEVGPSDLTPG